MVAGKVETDYLLYGIYNDEQISSHDPYMDGY